MRSSYATLLLFAAASFCPPGNLCAQQSPPAAIAADGAVQASPIAHSSSSYTKDSDSSLPAERNPRYKVNRDDVLSLSFPLSPEFNQKPTVQPDGFINLQGTNSVYILGMTVPEVAKTVKAAYYGILHAPIVDVDLLDFQKPYFIVSG